MERKFYTFLIVPGPRNKVFKLRLPAYMVHVMVAFAAVGVMTVAVLASTYARMLAKVSNYNDLRSEHKVLEGQYRNLENVVNQTNVKLDSLQSLASEVALTYGFGEARRPGFPHMVLSLATQSNSTLDSSYRASLYAFNLLKTMALTPQNAVVPQGILSTANLGVAELPSLWPVRGQITGAFGERMDPLSGEDAFHAGLDISAPYGSEVEASADGLVREAEREAGYGKEIVIDHGLGVTTRYGHLSKIYVIAGQEVKRGQAIGAVGTTGKTTGSHLHYEVRVKDAPVNPAKYLRG